VIVIPLAKTIQSCLNPLGAYLQKRIPIRYLTGIASTICIASIYCSSFAKTWDQFIFLYAVCFPTGVGLLYWPPIICGWEHFPNNKGRATGLIMGGFGFGGFIFGIFTTALANP
jgi:OFA family oxalate/formate antiporter-like MFS transporter